MHDRRQSLYPPTLPRPAILQNEAKGAFRRARLTIPMKQTQSKPSQSSEKPSPRLTDAVSLLSDAHAGCGTKPMAHSGARTNCAIFPLRPAWLDRKDQQNDEAALRLFISTGRQVRETAATAKSQALGTGENNFKSL